MDEGLCPGIGGRNLPKEIEVKKGEANIKKRA